MSVVCPNRFPPTEDKISFMRRAVRLLKKLALIPGMKLGTFIFDLFHPVPAAIPGKKSLYASPVGKYGKDYLAQVIRTFGDEDFDYIIFVYDDTEFNEPVYSKCTFIKDEGFKWYCAKRYLTPEFCSKYEYIFIWDDDIDVSGFSPKEFLSIMRRNNLQMAQPACSLESYSFFWFLFEDRRHKVGRYTDFVEIMVPVFRLDAWGKFRELIDDDPSSYALGSDMVARSFCGFRNMGIIDAQPVTHVKQLSMKPQGLSQYNEFIAKHKNLRLASFVSYGGLC